MDSEITEFEAFTCFALSPLMVENLPRFAGKLRFLSKKTWVSIWIGIAYVFFQGNSWKYLVLRILEISGVYLEV